jgi:hypothetical protein
MKMSKTSYEKLITREEENVLNILRYNDFSYRFSNTDGKFDIFAQEDDKKNAHDLDHEIKMFLKKKKKMKKSFLRQTKKQRISLNVY